MKTLILSTPRFIKKVPINLILYIIVEDYLSTVCFYDDLQKRTKSQVQLCKSLKDFEFELDSALLRINRNCLINLNHVIEVNKRNKTALLTNGEEFQISNRNFVAFKKITLKRKTLAFTSKSESVFKT
jgi:DNA-binding LytR/AlgR family response regulator